MAVIDIRKATKKLLPFFIEARINALNEADTVQRIIKFLEEVLGYNGFSEITREQAVKDRYVDLAIKIDNTVQFLIEVKAANIKLLGKHIEQAQNYASHGNIEWVLLTNGIDWQLYHLTFDEGIQYDKTIDISLDNPEHFDKSCDLLCNLHRKNVCKGSLDIFWEQTAALSPASLAKVLFFEDNINSLRKELRRSAGIRIEEEALVAAVYKMFSTEVREAIGVPRIRRKRKTRKAGEGQKEIEIVGSPIATD